MTTKLSDDLYTYMSTVFTYDEGQLVLEAVHFYLMAHPKLSTLEGKEWATLHKKIHDTIQDQLEKA